MKDNKSNCTKQAYKIKRFQKSTNEFAKLNPNSNRKKMFGMPQNHTVVEFNPPISFAYSNWIYNLHIQICGKYQHFFTFYKKKINLKILLKNVGKNFNFQAEKFNSQRTQKTNILFMESRTKNLAKLMKICFTYVRWE